mmetsp:Transcript_31634/g.97779  ORF Transcript_31634/g.97779 Transcript_31634/m.97779 type:complete len:244 (+) Transcript_31634:196-927(+)
MLYTRVRHDGHRRVPREGHNDADLLRPARVEHHELHCGRVDEGRDVAVVQRRAKHGAEGADETQPPGDGDDGGVDDVLLQPRHRVEQHLRRAGGGRQRHDCRVEPRLEERHELLRSRARRVLAFAQRQPTDVRPAPRRRPRLRLAPDAERRSKRCDARHTAWIVQAQPSERKPCRASHTGNGCCARSRRRARRRVTAPEFSVQRAVRSVREVRQARDGPRVDDVHQVAAEGDTSRRHEVGEEA